MPAENNLGIFFKAMDRGESIHEFRVWEREFIEGLEIACGKRKAPVDMENFWGFG